MSIFDHACRLCYDKLKESELVMAENGKLIVLEAIDDAVLAQLAQELCLWLRKCGLAVEETREPTYGPAGTQILLARQRRLQLDARSLALLYLADRLDHVQRSGGIESWLAAGRHVLCVHYGLAAAARLWGEVEWDWLCRIGALCRVPDLTLWIDLPPDGPPGRQLRENYVAVVQRSRKRGQQIAILDSPGTPAQLYLACRQQIAQLLGIEILK